jgi:cation:H+ antiporter
VSRYGDAISDKTGLGGSWVGLILLGTVTSLPELVTGISSVTVANTPDIAVGDILGSCVFNLLIIVILDFLHRGESLYSKASRGHILTGGFGIMLIGMVTFDILLSNRGTFVGIGHVGFASVVIAVLYMVTVRTIFRYESAQVEKFTEAESDQYPELSLRQAIIRYVMAAMLVLGAGAFLPFVAKDLAVLMEWHESFVGTLFVALATSLPEVVVTVAALRLGAVDMAIGNLFGSNLFNILVLVIDDLLYLPGPLLANVSPTHALSGLSAMIMTGVAIVGLLYRPRNRVLKTVGWTSIALFSIYLLNSYIAFVYSN